MLIFTFNKYLHTPMLSRSPHMCLWLMASTCKYPEILNRLEARKIQSTESTITKDFINSFCSNNT